MYRQASSKVTGPGGHKTALWRGGLQSRQDGQGLRARRPTEPRRRLNARPQEEYGDFSTLEVRLENVLRERQQNEVALPPLPPPADLVKQQRLLIFLRHASQCSAEVCPYTPHCGVVRSAPPAAVHRFTARPGARFVVACDFARMPEPGLPLSQLRHCSQGAAAPPEVRGRRLRRLRPRASGDAEAAGLERRVERRAGVAE